MIFEKYSSNTYAGSGNQLFFTSDEKEVHTGRVFYKISVGGKYNYSLLFSNIMDSTYSDGSVSHKNLICDSWVIHKARIGKSKDARVCEKADFDVYDFTDISFGGQKAKTVMPGEFFYSDAVQLEYEKGEYLCLEITFSGKMIPYHEETLLPVFIKNNDVWEYSKFMPFAGMVGCDRQVKGKIAYLGDSITQGIGAAPNSYAHWNAVLSEKLGDGYSYWNLGLGYGRANDAASDGAWLYKAKQNDIIFVCYGVNDINKGQSEQQIKNDLTYIVDTLKNAGKKVILQTVPPFDYREENIGKWERINSYILTELKSKADFVFDNTKILGKKEKPSDALYGGHPDEIGCKIWAEALFEELNIDKL